MQKSHLTIGLDLGDRRSHVCVLDDEGDVVARTEVAITRPGITKLPCLRRRHHRHGGGHPLPLVSALLEQLELRTLVADAR